MSDERQMPLEKPSEPVVDMEAALSQAALVNHEPPMHAPQFINLARAFLALRAEVEALRGELAMVDSAFGNPLALDNCKTRYDKICKMFREIDTLSNSGIIEVAVRNMNVRHYMSHWEGRTEKAEARAEASEARAAALVKALEKIERWELPATGDFWDDGSPVSYETNFGSNGARDFIREIARAALAPPAQDASEKETG